MVVVSGSDSGGSSCGFLWLSGGMVVVVAVEVMLLAVLLITAPAVSLVIAAAKLQLQPSALLTACI
jgi:hypothetical protein